MTPEDLTAIEARATEAQDTHGEISPAVVEAYDRSVDDVFDLLVAARDRDNTIARVQAVLDSAAKYRIDHELYGDDAYDDIETIDVAPLRAALDPQETP